MPIGEKYLDRCFSFLFIGLLFVRNTIMALSYFYTTELLAHGTSIILEEDASRHITQVLRMKKDDALLLTDGKGKKATAHVADDHRKRCTVKIEQVQTEEEPFPKICLAVSLIKNASRFEWFLEKATEIGVNEIIPMVCERTEKEKFRFDRMQNILISAMLQSQQCWLPILHEPASFDKVVGVDRYHQKFIAHCLPDKKQQLSFLISQLPATDRPSLNAILLIGPEGDFTEKEIDAAIEENFVAVALGNTRLRTETAGITGAVLLRAL